MAYWFEDDDRWADPVRPLPPEDRPPTLDEWPVRLVTMLAFSFAVLIVTAMVLGGFAPRP